MGGTTFQKLKAGAKISLLGLVLLQHNEAMNLVDYGKLNGAIVHDALKEASSSFTMIDEQDHISLRDKKGLEVFTLPGDKKTKEFYQGTLISHEEYVARGGRFSDWRRCVINGNEYYMETFDPTTGDTLSITKIDNIEDDIHNNYAITMEELIDFVKTVTGDSIVEMPQSAKGALSYFDFKTGNVIEGSPSAVLSSALQSAGFTEEQVDKLFAGTKFEDADKKAERISKLEETDEELASDRKREVVYYEADATGGKIDISKLKEASSSQVVQHIIDRYSKYVEGYEDADERIDEFTENLSAYVKDSTEEENHKKLATIISTFDAFDDGRIGAVRKNYDRRVDRMFRKNGIQHSSKKDRFEEFDEAMDGKIDAQLEYVEDIQDKFERLQNAEKEAMDYVNEGVAKGSLKTEHYDQYVQTKIKGIEAECEGATEDAVYDAWEDLDKLEKAKREMDDFRVLDFIISDCEERDKQNQIDEIANASAAFYMASDEDIGAVYNAVRDVDDLLSAPGTVTISASAASLYDEGQLFYGGDPEDLVSSSDLDEITTSAEAIYARTNEYNYEIEDPSMEDDESYDLDD